MSTLLTYLEVHNLTDIDKNLLLVMLDMQAIGKNKNSIIDIIKEVQRRHNNKNSGMKR